MKHAIPRDRRDLVTINADCDCFILESQAQFLPALTGPLISVLSYHSWKLSDKVSDKLSDKVLSEVLTLSLDYRESELWWDANDISRASDLSSCLSACFMTRSYDEMFSNKWSKTS